MWKKKWIENGCVSFAFKYIFFSANIKYPDQTAHFALIYACGFFKPETDPGGSDIFTRFAEKLKKSIMPFQKDN